ncbi:hypothetical protein N7532_008821 [Penicillium argentinense]|uniref:Nuclear membrane fusion protein Kar5 n=1 Tax=Penicillium argentinense TaxID=1131581 RepID=A0A9W9K2W4_9EURO|nr:uncharacterized protein N7532_008821 [Penicillium argentinense]KAJ5090137.1 hypothetical protein N7532_008821 [Penicillium argentinense]
MRRLNPGRVLLVLLTFVLNLAASGPTHTADTFGNLEDLSERARGRGNKGLLPKFGSRDQQQDALSVFTEAQQLINSIETLPSCTRIATSNLITSCNEIDARDVVNSDVYERLEHAKSIYAARLAICELGGAGEPVPPACTPVTTATPTARSRWPFWNKAPVPEPTDTFDVVSKTDLEKCLKALKSGSQGWTSYSNNRQNAVVICQTSRGEIEKAELLHAHRRMALVDQKLYQAQKQALHDAAVGSSEHKAFLKELKVMQESLATKLQESVANTQNVFGKLLREVQDGLKVIGTQFTISMVQVRGEVGNLEKSIQGTSDSLSGLRKALRELRTEAVSQKTEMRQMHDENALAGREEASRVDWLGGQIMGVIALQVQVIEQLETTVALADELQQKQQTQADAMDRVTSAAVNLQTAMNDMAERLKYAQGLHSGGIPVWTLWVLVAILIWFESPMVSIIACLFLLSLVFGNTIQATFSNFLQLFGFFWHSGQ